jgi:hypothetical protein
MAKRRKAAARQDSRLWRWRRWKVKATRTATICDEKVVVSAAGGDATGVVLSGRHWDLEQLLRRS